MKARAKPVCEEGAVTEAPRLRNREKTQEALQLAMLRVKNKGRRMSIAAVAAEAGVTPGLIHNTYPDIAESIRASIGRATRMQRDTKARQLATSKSTLREVNAQLTEATAQIAKLASINETLRAELVKLKAAASGKVVVLPARTRK